MGPNGAHDLYERSQRLEVKRLVNANYMATVRKSGHKASRSGQDYQRYTG